MITNVHERHLPVPATEAGALIDGLAGPDDRLWPHDRWPAMCFDRPLGVGAVGGHGPVPYEVREYDPGRRIRFGFLGPTGFHGYHEYVVVADGTGCRLRHTLVLEPSGRARLTWPLFYGPLHDALIEDSLDRATGGGSRWSAYVRTLRFVIGRRASSYIRSKVR